MFVGEKMRDLNRYFKYLGSTRIKNELNLFREFPRYNEVIKKYKLEYANSLTKPIEIPKGSKGQVYEIPYSLPGGDIFQLNISIDKLYNLINDDDAIVEIKNNKLYHNEFNLKRIKLNQSNNEDILKMQFDSEMLKVILDEKNIDKKYANGCLNNNEDIIIGDFYGITSESIPFVILDGNHRCYAKIRDGNKLINGVLVSRNVWINCLLSESDKMFIKIFFNIGLILGYRTGKCDFEYVSKNLYEI